MPHEKRAARYIGLVVAYDPNKKDFWVFEGKLEGIIAREAKGEYGFGYDPIFILESGKHYGEIEPGERDRINFRGKGIEKFIDYLKAEKYIEIN